MTNKCLWFMLYSLCLNSRLQLKIKVILNLANPANMCWGFVFSIGFIRTTMMQNHTNTKEISWKIYISSELCICEVKRTYSFHLHWPKEAHHFLDLGYLALQGFFSLEVDFYWYLLIFTLINLCSKHYLIGLILRT